MKGYNLPDNVSESDPEAPWNKEEQEEKSFCSRCGTEMNEDNTGYENSICLDCWNHIISTMDVVEDEP